MRRFLSILSTVVILSACSGSKDENVVYAEPEVVDNNMDRVINNVLIKKKTNNSIVYEYQNVRIDEVGQLAKRYCQDKGASDAILSDAVLHKNYARMALFECVVNNPDAGK